MLLLFLLLLASVATGVGVVDDVAVVDAHDDAHANATGVVGFASVGAGVVDFADVHARARIADVDAAAGDFTSAATTKTTGVAGVLAIAFATFVAVASPLVLSTLL
jgi:hypothetical protein